MPKSRRTLCGLIAYYIFISAFLIKNKNTIPKQKNKQKGVSTKMKIYEFMKLETGEILTYNEMLKDFAENYDGDDVTNCTPYTEYYINIAPIKAE